jgi:hypothetical protein
LSQCIHVFHSQGQVETFATKSQQQKSTGNKPINIFNIA